MEEKVTLKQKATTLIDNVRYYWNEPPKGKFMSFKEIASYSFGGIGAYLIACMSGACVLGATNVFITGTIGIGPTDMYILYVLAVLSSIPLTAVRANIIDNTRNKEGKYRPYILRMGLPSVLLIIGMVWFPYDKLALIVGNAEVLGRTADYIAKCAVVLLFNILMQFFYTFFLDAYENLIHVLSSNSQERADVASIKSIVYSLGPTVVNLIMPIVAQNIYHTTQTDIRVYRLVYPILSVISMALLIIVYANTQEKIIQAKTHVVQIKFVDALKAVAKNKYFWIISMAGWIGFLETAYSSILYWLYNYGGACSGNMYSLITTINGNAALWGMILAPFCIRKWGKKNVQIVTNLFNILFIILMLPIVASGTDASGNLSSFVIWGVLLCLYANTVVGAFAHVLGPSIQADIRDYQQYKTGERIDGMFAAVGTIGSIITLVTGSILPALQERYGMTAANAGKVTSDATLMSRVLPGSKSIGEILSEQAANGMDILNPSNALYDVHGTLIPLLRILIIVAAIGAVLNVIPFFFYDFTEDKQKSVVRVLKIRALFEDYGNNALNDRELVEAIDLVNNAREMAVAEPKKVSKEDYKSIKDKEKRKAAKTAYREALQYNEEIGISKFVCAELDKFSSANTMRQVELYRDVYNQGLDGIKNLKVADIKAEIKSAKALPKNTDEEKELRKIELEIARKKLSSYKHYCKSFGAVNEFVEPEISKIEEFYDIEDNCVDEIQTLSKLLHDAKKAGEKEDIETLRAKIKVLDTKRKEARKASKAEMDKHAVFNRAADVYITARKLLTQQENFSHFDEIAALYDEAKLRAEEEERIRRENAEKKRAEEKAELEKRKAERKAKANKNKK